MQEFEIGQAVGIRCDIEQGPFPGEYLVTMNTIDGDISGFVNEADITIEKDVGYIHGVVHEVTDEMIGVRITGSFFTTTGLAHLSSDWAKSNLQLLAAA